MLKNFVLETASAPGTNTTINLAGAATGRMSFVTAFSTTQSVFYFMDDGTQAEWGVGTFTTGSPNTLSRSTVVGNTAGNTSRLNFTGTTRVYNEVCGDRVAYFDSSNILTTTNRAINTGTGSLTVGGAATVGGNAVLTTTSYAAGSGWQKVPGGLYLQWGGTAAGTSGVQSFGVAFPTGVGFVGVTPTSPGITSVVSSFNTGGFSWGLSSSSAFNWFAVGN